MWSEFECSHWGLLIIWHFFFPFSFLYPATADFQVQQKPRFYGVKVGKQVGFTCFASDLTLAAVVKWYKIEKYEEDKVYGGQMHEFKNSRAAMYSSQIKGQLFIKDVEVKDSGIYYCRINQTWGPGTELQVFSKRALSWWRYALKVSRPKA